MRCHFCDKKGHWKGDFFLWKKFLKWQEGQNGQASFVDEEAFGVDKLTMMILVFDLTLLHCRGEFSHIPLLHILLMLSLQGCVGISISIQSGTHTTTALIYLFSRFPYLTYIYNLYHCYWNPCTFAVGSLPIQIFPSFAHISGSNPTLHSYHLSLNSL